MKKLKKNNGFSLIELMIVMAIIVIVSLSTWLSLFSFNRNRHLKNTVYSNASLLRDAQQRSINQEDGRYWGARFENSLSQDKYVLFNSTSTSTSNSDSATIVSTFFLKNSLEFLNPSINSSSTILFDRISGNWINNPDCFSDPNNTSSTIDIGIKNTDNFSVIKIYCNGRIEF